MNFQGLCENCQREQLANMQAALSPEQNQVLGLQEQIRQLTMQRDGLSQQVNALQGEQIHLNLEIQNKKQQVFDLDESIMLQDFGLYRPKYELMNADAYKARLLAIRQKQKDMIKSGSAVTGNFNWTVNGNKAQGTKMVKDMQKLLLRAFNSECDSVIEKVKYNTYDAAWKRITASANAITKLGSIMNVSISTAYYQLKCEELALVLEYQQKKQAEKEEQKAIRAQMREDARVAKEMEAERQKAEKALSHYQNAMLSLAQQISIASGEHLDDLLQKKADLEKSLQDAERTLKDIDYREANKKAGYVYVISNIGSFGENVYKIGMTRRLDPTERVDELGDASVPFDFDIHAMIFSEDAPALEAALHRAFENRKLNMVNTRREFFRVTLDEIKAVVKENYDKTAEFIDVADAEQFRISEKIRNNQ
ncbi:DUF4041 domain-containing protein [Ruthenibacterium lactatiformans]|uniref:DUF4041 domain-containing protein n=1 Tax=Ruthenibacterium lactatiformans TaxID=1550024 RepID=UPI00267321F3|nr:DUF4041 domain-containing protein [Ruthenibacterium lactatiformans]